MNPQPAPPAALPSLPIGDVSNEDEQFLLRAFHTFAQAAASLEQSYATLRDEVGALQKELALRNGELARTSEENLSMRVYLDRILEGLPCGVVAASAEGRIMRANPMAQALLGIERQSAPLAMTQISPAMQTLLETSRKEDAECERNVAPDGESERWLAARHASLPDGESIFILRDVTERKRLDEIEARSHHDRVLAEISALLAHEIRNPLGSLELFAGLLAESGLDDGQRRWVEQAQAGLRTLAATVNNVLQFHTSPEPERAPLDLGRLLEWASDFLQPLARQAGTMLSLQNELAGVMLAADRHQLEQVLLNLVLNSLRAVSDHGWIEIRGRKLAGGNAVVLAVADNGCGVSPSDLPSIFEARFSRRPASPGLGLSVCRKIVERHGGTIQAESRPGSGATFTITFPLETKLKGVCA